MQIISMYTTVVVRSESSRVPSTSTPKYTMAESGWQTHLNKITICTT